MTGSQLPLALLVAIVAFAALAIWREMRRRHRARLRPDFGRQADLGQPDAAPPPFAVFPLSDAQRESFHNQWGGVMARFADSPVETVLHADRLVTTMLVACGVPMTDVDHLDERQLANYPRLTRNYRAGHGIAIELRSGAVPHARLCQAIGYYRGVFDELGGLDSIPGEADAVADKADRSRNHLQLVVNR